MDHLQNSVHEPVILTVVVTFWWVSIAGDVVLLTRLLLDCSNVFDQARYEGTVRDDPSQAIEH